MSSKKRTTSSSTSLLSSSTANKYAVALDPIKPEVEGKSNVRIVLILRGTKRENDPRISFAHPAGQSLAHSLAKGRKFTGMKRTVGEHWRFVDESDNSVLDPTDPVEHNMTIGVRLPTRGQSTSTSPTPIAPDALPKQPNDNRGDLKVAKFRIGQLEEEMKRLKRKLDRYKRQHGPLPKASDSDDDGSRSDKEQHSQHQADRDCRPARLDEDSDSDSGDSGGGCENGPYDSPRDHRGLHNGFVGRQPVETQAGPVSVYTGGSQSTSSSHPSQNTVGHAGIVGSVGPGGSSTFTNPMPAPPQPTVPGDAARTDMCQWVVKYGERYTETEFFALTQEVWQQKGRL